MNCLLQFLSEITRLQNASLRKNQDLILNYVLLRKRELFLRTFVDANPGPDAGKIFISWMPDKATKQWKTMELAELDKQVNSDGSMSSLRRYYLESLRLFIRLSAGRNYRTAATLKSKSIFAEGSLDQQVQVLAHNARQMDGQTQLTVRRARSKSLAAALKSKGGDVDTNLVYLSQELCEAVITATRRLADGSSE
eukprot:COSAG06_NODE_20474_length_794_cov_1.027338_1_plen_194_part_10